MSKAQLCSLFCFVAYSLAQTGDTVAATGAVTPEADQDGGTIALQVIAAVVLTLSAGLFSGLTLGLMSLDSLELELLIKAGDKRQARYAKKIRPVRRAGNRLLCTLVLTNTAIYTLLPIVVSNLTDGLVGFIISTVLSVLFGEIIPQSICSRHGLAIGAYTVWVVRFLMVVLFPLAWPIAKILDLALGKEIAEAYSRKELTELIAYHALGKLEEGGGDLNVDETTIIRNALRFSLTPVNEVMTPLAKVFMLPINGVLDGHTMVRISKAGYSRVPVVENTRGNVVGLLIVKTLFLLSPEARIPIKKVLDVTKHKSVYVEYGTSLDVMLNAFQWGKSHLAVVRRLKEDCTDEQLANAKKDVRVHSGSADSKTVDLVNKPPIEFPPRRKSKSKSSDKHKKDHHHHHHHHHHHDDNDSSGTDGDDEDDSEDSAARRERHAGKKRVRVKKRVRRSPVEAQIEAQESSDGSTSSSDSTYEEYSTDSEDEIVMQEKQKKQEAAHEMLKQKELVQGEAAAKLQAQLQSDKYVTVGVVTLEDVVEELIGEEIYDETDFDEGSVAAATAGRDAVDQMMTMAYAAIKWRQLANVADPNVPPPNLPAEVSAGGAVNAMRKRRRHHSVGTLTLSGGGGGSRFKSDKVNVKTLLKTETSDKGSK